MHCERKLFLDILEAIILEDIFERILFYYLHLSIQRWGVFCKIFEFSVEQNKTKQNKFSLTLTQTIMHIFVCCLTPNYITCIK